MKKINYLAASRRGIRSLGITTIVLLFIITIPAFLSLLNNSYFSMHDDQHVARLFLLDAGIRQGSFYPRWVDMLGFGFGYPLFNFYPPLTYYIAETFHLIGFSLVWSIKLTFITGFVLTAGGMYLFAKRLMGKLPAFLSAILYTYFFYHAVLIYVRGALAEFFSLAVLPFVLTAIDALAKKTTLGRSVFLGVTFALLILTHPLMAFPFLFYLGAGFIFYLLLCPQKRRFTTYFAVGIGIGLTLSAFFWLPSMVERKHTLVDNILTKELANYKLHFIYPSQFLYSPWGYGGSIAGRFDGMTFQLGKMYIFLVILSFLTTFYLIISKQQKTFLHSLNYYYFFFILFVLSLFMTTSYSSLIWNNFKYLWYLQFPWRFLSLVGFFISLLGGYSLFFLFKLFQRHLQPPRLHRTITTVIIGIISLSVLLIYQKYFRPQRLIRTNDAQLTAYNEMAWRVSRSSFEFIPRGVVTKKTELNTTIPAIEKQNLAQKPYEILSGQAEVKILKNQFSDKRFLVNAASPITFRLNTYDFPGWTAYLNKQRLPINNENKYKLITVNIPPGQSTVTFRFVDTPVRTTANMISLISLVGIMFIFGSVFPFPAVKYQPNERQKH